MGLPKHRFPIPYFSLFSGGSTASYSEFLTPPEEAIEELKKRREDPALKRRVEEYLNEDIPEHFTEGPILYLARHVATPNFETLRFLHLVEPMGFPAVIGQDLEDKFVPNNQLKRALGKLPVSLGMSPRSGRYIERYENLNVIDFNAANGKPLNSIQTHWGEPIHDFHSRLFNELCRIPVRIVNDSEWINRNGRGDLLAHYKRFLALFVTHGILFEDYSIKDEEEIRFVREILRPAARHIQRRFGLRPLIVQLTPTGVESSRYWISYPSKVGEIVRLSRAQSQPAAPSAKDGIMRAAI